MPRVAAATPVLHNPFRHNRRASEMVFDEAAKARLAGRTATPKDSTAADAPPAETPRE